MKSGDGQSDGIPEVFGTAAGLFAGATVGWGAGGVLGHALAHMAPGPLHDSNLIENVVAASGAFGCAYAGYMLAKRKPAEAVLIAATAIARPGLFGSIDLPSSPLAGGLLDMWHPHADAHIASAQSIHHDSDAISSHDDLSADGWDVGVI